MTAVCHDIPGSEARALDPSPAAGAVLSHTRHSHWLTSSHLIQLTHKTKGHPKKWKRTHRAIISWYQDLSHWQKKASDPNSCHHLSPARILPGIRSARPGPGDTTTFGTQAAAKNRKDLSNASTLCWMAKQRVLQSQSNFLALAVKLIFKKMACTTALGHSDHFLWSWNQSELLNSSSNPS